MKWLSGELDAARNLDVLLHGEFRALVGRRREPEAVRDLGARLRGARRMAYVRAAGAVESDRFRRLLLDTLVWVETGPWAEAPTTRKARGRAIAGFAARELARRRRKILRRGEDLRELEPPTRHQLRIEAKKLRYAADVFVALFDRPKRARAFVSALKDLQDALGELNDIVVGERVALESAAGPVRAVVGLEPPVGLFDQDAARASALTDRAEAALARFREARRFWK
jgi:triphosphatase